MRSVYDETYARSLARPEEFWAAAAEDLYWDRRWDRVFDGSRPPHYRWFVGGMLNTCYNALDLHIDRGRGKQRALVYDSPVTESVRTFTYAELRDTVARVAGAPGRRPFGRVRRLRAQRAGQAHRRRAPQADPFGVVWHRAGPNRRVQAAARR